MSTSRIPNKSQKCTVNKSLKFYYNNPNWLLECVEMSTANGKTGFIISLQEKENKGNFKAEKKEQVLFLTILHYITRYIYG